MPIDLQNEVDLVKAVLSHPAGYELDLLGAILTIRSPGGPQNTEESIEVEWNAMIGTKPEVGSEVFDKSDLEGAAMFFVKKRHALRLGIDFEAVDVWQKVRRESPR